jgi:hypothetical protein
VRGTIADQYAKGSLICPPRVKQLATIVIWEEMMKKTTFFVLAVFVVCSGVLAQPVPKKKFEFSATSGLPKT